MKKMFRKTLAIVMVIVMMAIMTMPVLAVDNVRPSVTKKNYPVLVVDGGIAGAIVVEDPQNAGEFQKVDDIDEGQVIISPYGDKDNLPTELDPTTKTKIKNNLEAAYIEITGTNDLGELSDELDDIAEEIGKKQGKTFNSTVFVVSDLFDLTTTDDILSGEGKRYVRILLDSNAQTSDETPVVIYREGGGVWGVVSSARVKLVAASGEGTKAYLDVILDGDGVFGLLVVNPDKYEDKDNPNPGTGAECCAGCWCGDWCPLCKLGLCEYEYLFNGHCLCVPIMIVVLLIILVVVFLIVRKIVKKNERDDNNK